MDDLQKTYPQFHRAKQSVHVYPTEWVIRTLLGRYPRLALDSTKYAGSRILDLGFGDCRNMPLLANCGFDIYGVEISDDVIELGRATLDRLNISATLRRGTCAAIPFEDGFFDYVLACYSCYYIDKGSSFEQHLDEIARVLKPGGIFIASLVAPGNFIVENAQPHGDGNVTIVNDIFGLRNGYVFRTFEDEEDVRKTFARRFTNIVVSGVCDDFWGLQINAYFAVGRKT